mgnify:CR=1 FL=1
MKILIVGASGFLGRKLFNDLLADKHDVVGSSRTKRDFLKLDITDHENLKLVLEQGNFDTAINLAAVGVSAASAWSEVKDSAPRPARSAGVVVTDSGDGGNALATFLAEKKLI